MMLNQKNIKRFSFVSLKYKMEEKDFSKQEK